jgi:hypothetical protein
MKYGTSLPLVAAMDHAALRDFAQTLDGAGFDYLTVRVDTCSAPSRGGSRTGPR